MKRNLYLGLKSASAVSSEYSNRQQMITSPVLHYMECTPVLNEDDKDLSSVCLSKCATYRNVRSPVAREELKSRTRLDITEWYAEGPLRAISRIMYV